MQAAMRAIRSSTLSLLLLLALSCNAHPSSKSGSRDHRFPGNIEETRLERLAALVDRQDGSEADNWNDDRWEGYLDAARELRILDDQNQPSSFRDSGIEDQTNADKPKNPFNDYEIIDKRAPSRGKYNYYRCYFNPVTCYRK